MTVSEQRVYDDLANSPFDQLMGFDISEISQDGLTLVFHNVGTAWDNPNGTLYGGVFLRHGRIRNGEDVSVARVKASPS